MAQIILQQGQTPTSFDTILYDGNPNTNYSLYDRWEFGHESANHEAEIVKFDLSSIPAGSIITSVVLSVYVTDVVGTGDTATFRRILAGNTGWYVDYPTWNNQNKDIPTPWAGSVGCSTIGTDISNTKLAEKAAGTWVQSAWNDITLDVGEFLLMWANNDGFRIGTETTDNGNRIITWGMDAPVDTNRPKLTITYTPPPVGRALWLKVDDLALSDGDPVDTWTDASGAGNDFTQTGAARPIYRTNRINGMAAVTSDGTQWLERATFFGLPTGASPRTVIIVTQPNGNVVQTSTNLFGYGETDMGELFDWYTINETGDKGHLHLHWWGWGLDSFHNSYNVNKPHVHMIKYDGAKVVWYVDNEKASEYNVLFNTSNSLVRLFGGIQFGLTGTKADISEVMLYNTEIDQTEQDALWTYFQAKYNIGFEPPHNADYSLKFVSPGVDSFLGQMTTINRSELVPDATFDFRMKGEPSEATGNFIILGLGLELGISYEPAITKTTLSVWDGSGVFQAFVIKDLYDGQWHHIECAMSETNHYLQVFVDGVGGAQVPFTQLDPAFADQDVTFARWWYTGKLSEWRFSNTIRHTADFTPPTTRYTTDANTTRLWHMNETAGQSVFDESANAKHITMTSGSRDPVWVDDSPFADALTVQDYFWETSCTGTGGGFDCKLNDVGGNLFIYDGNRSLTVFTPDWTNIGKIHSAVLKFHKKFTTYSHNAGSVALGTAVDVQDLSPYWTFDPMGDQFISLNPKVLTGLPAFHLFTSGYRSVHEMPDVDPPNKQRYTLTLTYEPYVPPVPTTKFFGVKAYPIPVYPPFDTDHVKTTTFMPGAGGHDPYVGWWTVAQPPNYLIGDDFWHSNSTSTNERFHVDFVTPTVIKQIEVVNSSYPGYGLYGVRHFTVWGSNMYGAFNNLAYGDDTGWTQIPTDITEIPTYHTNPDFITLTNNTAYRYYAIKCADTWGGSFMMISYLQFWTTTMPSVWSPNVFLGATPMADSYYNAYHPIEAINDGFDGSAGINTAHDWLANGLPPPHWAGVDLGAGNEKALTRIGFDFMGPGDGYGLTQCLVKSFVISGSNDNVIYTPLYSGQTLITDAGWKYYTFANTTAYRYYKFDFLDEWSPYLIGFWEVAGYYHL